MHDDSSYIFLELLVPLVIDRWLISRKKGIHDHHTNSSCRLIQSNIKMPRMEMIQTQRMVRMWDSISRKFTSIPNLSERRRSQRCS